MIQFDIFYLCMHGIQGRFEPMSPISAPDQCQPTHPIIHENNTENRDLTLRIELTLKREMQIDANKSPNVMLQK